MKIIGLTGGVATGKSIVAGLFKRIRLPVIDADEISRHVVEPGSPILARLVEVFGNEILFKDKTLNRGLLRQIVFDSNQKRDQLNRIMHPAVIGQAEKMLNEFRGLNTPLVILEVPLLFETGYNAKTDKTIVVYATESQQIERLIKRDGCTKDHAKKMTSAQIPIDEKAKLADYIIDNSGSIGETERQVEELVKKLKELQ